MSTSAIEWTDATWNPVTGCDRVSPGCANCYALDLAPRLRAMGNAKYQGARDGGKSSGPAFGVTLHPSTLDQPLRWKKPRMVFVNSMSDLFHEEIPDEYIRRVFSVMARCPQHTFQVLTKRPERMRLVVGEMYRQATEVNDVIEDWFGTLDRPAMPLPNVWLGVSIENRRFGGRADVLRETPATVRFISAEPLLGPLVCPTCGGAGWDVEMGGDGEPIQVHCPECVRRGVDLDLRDIDWLIVGGESGSGHRPMRPEWVRDLCDLTERTDTAFFFKQWGGRTPKAGGRELDGRTWDEMPQQRVAA